MSAQSVYDLASAKLPRATRFMLRLLVFLLESKLLRGLIVPGLMANSGILRLRALTVDDPPTFMPWWPFEMPATKATAIDLDKLPRSPRPQKIDFAFWSVRDYAEAYRKGAITPEDVARHALEAIEASEKLDPPMRIFIAVDGNDVLAQARASAQRFEAGKPLGLFDGVPVAVKDEFDMLPYPRTVGTRCMANGPVREDASAVAAMRAAGALLLGKANMHEIGINPSGVNPWHGIAQNPYKPGYETGGSSSGPAAAVASGLCPVAIGADGGGSIRIPSAFCGLVGLKATFARISEFGAAPLTWSMGHIGPLAATAEDAALAYAVIAGPDPRDASSQHQPPPRLDGLDQPDLKGLTMGVYREWFAHADPQIVAACEEMLKKLGAKVKEIEIPELYAAYIAHGLTILSEMSSGVSRYDTARRDAFSAPTRLSLALIRAGMPSDYVQAQRVRTRTMAHFAAALEEVDVIVTPTTAISAPAYRPDVLPDGESDLATVIEMMRFVNPGNFTGLPAVSIPVGYTGEGLPIGMHFMGRAWEEHILLRIAYAADGLIERRKPQVWYDLLGG
jgi:Asp-tRNA(Asn)/Glu-tRNA(Gln) amidotransferase A subunit family amidase